MTEIIPSFSFTEVYAKCSQSLTFNKIFHSTSNNNPDRDHFTH